MDKISNSVLKKIEDFLEPLITDSIAIVDKLGLQILMKKDTSSLSEEKRPEADKLLKKYLEIEETPTVLKRKNPSLRKRPMPALKPGSRLKCVLIREPS